MESRDPPPFGYTFNPDFFGGQPSNFNAGPSLLSENENQSLTDFFNNTDPFLSDTLNFAPSGDIKEGENDFHWPFIPPATIHQVSTISDQAQLQHGFHVDHNFGTDNTFTGSNLATSQDDLQAASTLFNNAQASHTNGRSYSFQGLSATDLSPHSTSQANFVHPPLVPTPHGHIDEQLAALLPHHSEKGSVDETLVSHFSQLNRQQVEQHRAERARHHPHLKRSYTYGTDNAFNANGYIVNSPHETEAAITSRLLHDLRSLKPATETTAHSTESTKSSSPTEKLPIGLFRDDSDANGQSDDESSAEDDERPAKKRRKSKNASPTKASRKSISAGRPGKARKASLDEQNSKKKRPSSAGQKVQRENLTEEQKRSNHILSEQKRRNLIKKGFDDLNELVPEIRNGGLSKSSVLMEAGTFLEKLINENEQFRQILHAGD